MKYRCFAILAACLVFCSGAGDAVGAAAGEAAKAPVAVQGVSVDKLDKMSLPPVLQKCGRRLMEVYAENVRRWDIEDPAEYARALQGAEESVLGFMEQANKLYQARLAYADACLTYMVQRYKAADVPLDTEDFDDDAYVARMRGRFVKILDASFERDCRALIRIGFLSPEDGRPEEPVPASDKPWVPFLGGDAVTSAPVSHIRRNARAAALRAYVQGMAASYTEDLVCNTEEILTHTPWEMPDSPDAPSAPEGSAGDWVQPQQMADLLRKAEEIWAGDYVRSAEEFMPYNQYVRYTETELDELQWALEESCQQYLVEISEGLKEEPSK